MPNARTGQARCAKRRSTHGQACPNPDCDDHRITDPTVHQSPAYACAKTAVLGLTRFAARELGPFGITVNCLVPSLTLSGPVLQGYWDRMSEAAQASYLQQVALRRLPRPGELTSAVLFLCSDESGYITGVALDVNGGSFMP